MEENSSFISVNKNKKEKKRGYRYKLNQLLTINIQKLVIIILILIIIILCLIIGVLLLTRNSENNLNLPDESIKIQNFTDIPIIKKNSEKENEFNEISNVSSNKRLFQIRYDPIPTGKNQIHIAMAIDNKFIYPTLVSMASGLYNNNNKKNVIVYHLLCSHDFDKEKFEIFDSLKKRYEFSLNYYIIPELFGDFRKWSGSTDTVYYKIIIPLLFHDLKRIIYLDADTLIFKDLYEMYNLPFNGNYVLGYPFHDSYKIDKYVNNATYYINGGVILFNNELIRKDNKDLELIKFTQANNGNLWFLEQDSINIVFYEKIGILPLKYGIYMYGNIDSFEKSIQIRIRFKLNRTEVINAIEDPSLVHFSCCNPKVWYKFSNNEFGVHEICRRFHDEFYFYANKTDYYSEICKAYNN